ATAATTGGQGSGGKHDGDGAIEGLLVHGDSPSEWPEYIWEKMTKHWTQHYPSLFGLSSPNNEGGRRIGDRL
ncbi:hypothetical protein, partial [Thioalkalivibrio sp.]|uniref:hypothetical protein n=1 Tax=Thioalkalivibrio sp. TaxID=2093813 RepID=UPI003566B857